ncbi:MAG: dihydrolipoyllysine-residue succinyltransferase [Legionellales bacterium]|nr:dihydrolipoyllysine-residue succinyltransferase [Legionellales bacterium]OUX64731.1 MAG: dihydrolipoamide succinyltransferase [Gammaproteobacteria bacterium TMED281]
MTLDITVPVLPESVPDATIASINVKAGDLVTESTVLIELETDKIMIEVPAPTSGLVNEIIVKVNDQVKSGELLIKFEEKNIADTEPASSTESTPVIEQTSTNIEEKSVAPTESKEIDQTKLGPSARKAMRQGQITESIVPSGPKGRVMKNDILKAQSIVLRKERRVAMTRIRSKIAERLIDAQQSTACLTTFNEVDMKAVMDIRSKYKKDFEDRHDVRLGFMSFFIRAVCYALQKFPEANASIDGQEIVYRDYQDIGIAVSTDRGLVVPIIRDAHTMGMAELELSVKDLATKARDAKLTMEDMQGGTFSITNAGRFGSMLSTPILNPPQSAILGMHNIVERPVVINGEIVIRPIMYLALTYDHRMIDGSTSVQFLMTIKELLEDPTRLLLDI